MWSDMHGYIIYVLIKICVFRKAKLPRPKAHSELSFYVLSKHKMHFNREINSKNEQSQDIYSKWKLQQGVRFDPDMPQTIRLEFAKSNTKGKTIKHPDAAGSSGAFFINSSGCSFGVCSFSKTSFFRSQSEKFFGVEKWKTSSKSSTLKNETIWIFMMKNWT